MNSRLRIGVWTPAGWTSPDERSAMETAVAAAGLPETTTADGANDFIEWVHPILGNPREASASGSGPGPASREDGGEAIEAIQQIPFHGLVRLVDVPGDPTQPSGATGATAQFLPLIRAYIPTVSESELSDPDARESFFEQAAGVQRIEQVFRPGWRVNDLVAFNAAERFRAIVHDPKRHKLIGRIVAKAKDHDRASVVANITGLYLEALAKPTTRRKHLSLFKHVDELLGDRLASTDREELHKNFEAYRAGDIGRQAPIHSLQELVQKHGVRGFETQSYLFPNALEMACMHR